MKRIFDDYAYGTEPIDTCYWAKTVPSEKHETLESDTFIDVAIIGGGFTGLNAALHLAENGREVAVLDAGFPGFGASGRNGGFCCLGGAKAGNTTIRKNFGEDARKEFRAAEMTSVDFVATLLKTHKIDADVHSDGETLLAHTEKEAEKFRRFSAEIESDYGIRTTFMNKSELTAHGMKGPFFGAVTIPVGFALNPQKYVAGLVDAICAYGAKIYSNTPVHKIEKTTQGYLLQTPKGKVWCKHLIIATNGYSSEDVPNWMRAKYLPIQSHVIVTRPLTDTEISAQGWTSHQMSYDTRELLHYFRLMPNRRFLFGMRGGTKTNPREQKASHARVRQHFETMFPEWRHVETPYSWSGFVCLSAGLVPFCGPIPEMPNAFTAFAYHGNGVAMGSYAGKLLAELVLGNAGHIPKVMQRNPRRFPLGSRRKFMAKPAFMLANLLDK